MPVVSPRAGKLLVHIQGSEGAFKKYFERRLWSSKMQGNQSTEQDTRTKMKTSTLSILLTSSQLLHSIVVTIRHNLSSPWIAAGLHARWLSPWARTPLKVWNSLAKTERSFLAQGIQIPYSRQTLSKWLIACWINTKEILVIHMAAQYYKYCYVSTKHKPLSKTQTKIAASCTYAP